MILFQYCFGSLVVGAIAGLSLTTAAFQRPLKLRTDYEEKISSYLAQNPFYLEEDKKWIKSKSKSWLLDGDIMGICVLDVTEFSVIFLYLLTEILMILTLFLGYIDYQCSFTNYQTITLFIGYLLLIGGLTITMTSIFIALVAASKPIRGLKSIERQNDLLERLGLENLNPHS